MGFPDFGAWPQAAARQLGEQFDKLLCATRDTAAHCRDTATAVIGMARTLAYQYGAPPESGTLTPRSMTELPHAVDYDLDELPSGVRRLQLDLVEIRNRPAQAGYIANVGDVPLVVAWVGVDRTSTGMFRLPVGASLQVPCIVRGVLCESAPGESGGVLQVNVL